ncbi:MAG: sensor histidine kinase [Bacilli bacterium]
MKSIFLEIMVFISIYLYNLFLISYNGKVVGFKLNKKKALIFFPIIITIISFIIILNLVFLPLGYIINFIVYMLVFKLVFDKPLGAIYILIICQIFQMIINRDIITGITVLLYGNSMFKMAQNYNLYIFTSALTNIIAIILGTIFSKEIYINKVRLLLLYRKKLLLNIITITGLVIVLLNSNFTYYYSGDIHTTTMIMISNRICIYFCLFFAIVNGLKSIKWVEEEESYKTRLLNLEYNVNLDKKVEEYSSLLKIYNHDYKNILYNIRDSIELGDTEKAKEIILEFDKKIYGLTDYNKKLSNNSLINALLNRLHEECKTKNICFDSECYIPSNLSVTELELISIFNNLSSNAIEACVKQKNNEKRWIKFKSYIKDNNFIIYQCNSFDGHIKFRNEKLITTKENKKIHGIGVESIKYIVSEANGISLVKVDKENREFKFLIKIPLLADK